MKTTWKENRLVETTQVTLFNKLKLSALCGFFQEAASNNADYLGFGYNHLKAVNQFWVLTRLKVEIDAQPMLHDDLIIETWPTGVEGLFASRDYNVYCKSKNIIRATSSWLILDATTFRPQKPDELSRHIEPYETVRHFNAMPEKILPVAGSELMYTRTILFSDLDINLHVNNTRYMDFISDCFRPSELQEKSIAGICINFIGQLKWGDVLELKRSNSSDSSVIEGCLVTGASIFTAQVDFKSKDTL